MHRSVMGSSFDVSMPFPPSSCTKSPVSTHPGTVLCGREASECDSSEQFTWQYCFWGVRGISVSLIMWPLAHVRCVFACAASSFHTTFAITANLLASEKTHVAPDDTGAALLLTLRLVFAKQVNLVGMFALHQLLSQASSSSAVSDQVTSGWVTFYTVSPQIKCFFPHLRMCPTKPWHWWEHRAKS